MHIDLRPGEKTINTWTIKYQLPGSRKFNGKLTVTNKRLLYDTRFDIAARGLMPELMFVKWGSIGYVEIDKMDIRQIEVRRTFLIKKTVLTLTDGSKHIFRNAILSFNNLAKAINQ